jgi:hypothetical protein
MEVKDTIIKEATVIKAIKKEVISNSKVAAKIKCSFQ